jgi:hypothetical protein
MLKSLIEQPSILLAVIMLTVSCNNQSPGSQNQEIVKTDTTTDKTFFPVADFIGGEIHIIIDSLKPPITKIRMLNGKSNVESVNDEEFRQLAKPFLEVQIDKDSIKQFYKETNVADQSTETVNLVYNSTNPNLPIRRLDVNIKPDPIKNDKVSSVYIEKQFKTGDTIINQRLIWKVGKHFQIITEKNILNKIIPREIVKVVWDPTD